MMDYLCAELGDCTGKGKGKRRFTVLPANTPHLPLPRTSPEGATSE